MLIILQREIINASGRFSCHFCGRVFDDFREFVLHRSKHLSVERRKKNNEALALAGTRLMDDYDEEGTYKY